MFITFDALKRIVEAFIRPDAGWIDPTGVYYALAPMYDFHHQFAKQIVMDTPGLIKRVTFNTPEEIILLEEGWVRAARSNAFEGPHPKRLSLDVVKTIERLARKSTGSTHFYDIWSGEGKYAGDKRGLSFWLLNGGRGR